MYHPSPLNTTHVQVPKEIEDLLERLAENTHDVWAQQRIADGWSFGPVRDDAKKQTPCLVPYGELPEEEKEYDRKTAMETIKVILALGYRIHF